MKKILAMVLSVAIIATIAITGSVAYLTSEAREVNTMTMGEVKIVQNELKRTGNGYTDFDNDMPLYPAVYGDSTETSGSGEGNTSSGTASKGDDGFWTNVAGAQDKIVSVTNTGKSDAYVRTWFAFEADAEGKLEYIHINWKTQPDSPTGTKVTIEEDGEQNDYIVFCVTYSDALASGATTENSLLEVHMDPQANNEYVAHFGDTYKILVVSQAVQVENMGAKSASAALNLAFPAAHPWTTGIYDADLVIYDAEDLFELAKTINTTTTQEHYIGKTIVLANDIDLAGVKWTPIGVGGDSSYYFGGTFDGQGHTIYNLYVNQSAGNHAAGLFGALRGTVKNLTIDGAVINNVTTVPMNGTAVVAGSMTYGTDYKNECKIENVTVKNAKVNGNRYVAGICGMANVGSIVNCSVYDSELTAACDELTNSWDNGDKVGGILGFSGEVKGVYSNTISGCTVNNVTIKGYRNLGGIVGHGVDANLSGNTATNLTFYQDMTHDYKNYSITGKYVDTINGAKESGNATLSTESAITTIEISNAAQLRAFADDVNSGNAYNGKTVKLTKDIDLKNKNWTPIGKGYYEGSTWKAAYFTGTFDGQNHTISNLTVNNSDTSYGNASGLFGFNEQGIIKNVKIKGANITGHQYCGVVAGYLSNWNNATIENCHVEDATVTSIHSNSDACGDKAGAIVGHTLTTVKDCSATNCTIKAARDAGQIAGAAYEANVIGCTATNVSVSRETTVVCDDTNAGQNIHNDRLYGREP